jgi:hypothetical protein
MVVVVVVMVVVVVVVAVMIVVVVVVVVVVTVMVMMVVVMISTTTTTFNFNLQLQHHCEMLMHSNDSSLADECIVDVLTDGCVHTVNSSFRLTINNSFGHLLPLSLPPFHHFTSAEGGYNSTGRRIE